MASVSSRDPRKAYNNIIIRFLSFSKTLLSHLSRFQHEAVARVDLLLRVGVDEVGAACGPLDARHRGMVPLLDAHAGPNLKTKVQHITARTRIALNHKWIAERVLKIEDGWGRTAS